MKTAVASPENLAELQQESRWSGDYLKTLQAHADAIDAKRQRAISNFYQI